MAYSIASLMAVVHASRDNRKKLAADAKDEILKEPPSGGFPQASDLDPEQTIDPNSSDYGDWPADMLLGLHGEHTNHKKLVTWREFDDVGTRTPDQAVDHAIGQIIEGIGKVKHALEIVHTAYLKSEWCRKVDGLPPQTQEEFEANEMGLLATKAAGVRGRYFEKMRQNAAPGGSQETCPQETGSAFSASA